MDEKAQILDESIENEPFIDAILKPHIGYYKALKGLFASDLLKGMAHITGGGIKEDLNRILPNNLMEKIHIDKYKIPGIFKLLKTYGDISDLEMLRTFNMGVEMALVVSPNNVDLVIEHISRFNVDVDAYVIGSISEGNKNVECFGSFNWK